MCSQQQSDELISLQPVLASLAQLIADGLAIDARQIEKLLRTADLDPDAASVQELLRAVEILSEVRQSQDADSHLFAVARLRLRGWMEAPARAAVSIVAGARPAASGSAPAAALKVSPDRLEWTLPAGQVAQAEILVEGGPGIAASDSDQVTVAPTQFGSNATRIEVVARPMGNAPLLWANVTLLTPQDTRVVPVVAQWQDASTAAGVAPVQTHQATSSALVPQAAQTRIAREMAAPPAVQTSAMSKASGVLKKVLGLAPLISIAALVLAVTVVGVPYVWQAAVPTVAQPATGGTAAAVSPTANSTTLISTAEIIAAATQLTKTSTSTAAPTLTNTPTASPSATPTRTATPEPTAAPTNTPTATPILLPSFTVKEGSSVNVRSGPGTNYDVIGQLQAGTQRTIRGRTAANDWWQFDFNGQMGWVSNQVVVTNPQAGAIAIAAALPSPTPRSVPLAGATAVSPIDGMAQVFVPAGEFIMGSDKHRGSITLDNEAPQHRVYLDAFWIDRTEVTNAMFARFVRETGYRTRAEELGIGQVYVHVNQWEMRSGADWQHPFGPNSDVSKLGQNPVVLMSWKDASAYCTWAGRRLPTEAEWEKAARGVDGRAWPWGNQPPIIGGSLDSIYGYFAHAYQGTASVGSYPAGASPYGALDMVGNAKELVADYYAARYYDSSPGRNPQGPDSGEWTVVKGGSWNWGIDSYRPAERGAADPDTVTSNIGFRCTQSE